MAVYTNSYPSGPPVETTTYQDKPIPWLKKPMHWLSEGVKDVKAGADKILSFGLLVGIVSVIAGGAVAWFAYHYMNDQLRLQARDYEKKIHAVSFNHLKEELGRIDPQEKKNFVTTQVLCSDNTIESNPEADMQTVCLNDYYWRKEMEKRKRAKVKIAMASGGE